MTDNMLSQILVGAVVFLLGGALQTGAQGLSYLYAGRGTFSEVTALEFNG